MAVSQIVDSDPLNPCRLSTSVHFVMKIAFRDFKQPVVFADSVELFYIVLHFFTEELRHFNCPVAFRRFRISDDIPATDALIRFVDCNRLPFKIEISWGQCQQFALADTTPVEHFKSIKGQRLVHHSINEFQVFIFGPEQHFTAFLLAHAACFYAGVFFQVVIPNRMVEDCTQLILDGLEVNRRVGLSIFVAIVDQFILPADNLLRRDAAHFQLAEVGQQFGSDNVVLALPGALLCGGDGYQGPTES